MPTCTMDGPTRPNGSDLLKADRLKAGGMKPGTWALNIIPIPARRHFTCGDCSLLQNWFMNY
jgi:hypothetical protein